MDGFLNRILLAAVCACTTALPLAAQPSLPPGPAPKPERETAGNEIRKSEEARREAAAIKAGTASKKSSSSSSKTKSAEIRAMAFADVNVRGNRPVIIKSGGDAKVRDQLKEDLLVMCRIIEKAAQEHITEVHKAAGIDLLALGGGNRSVRTIYLEDYGVIFTLNVRIPLLNDAKADEPEAKETTRNEEWEETRNEIFGQKKRIRKVHSHGPTFDEQDVQQLKVELIDALKNAANIRNLKASDSITVAVNGPGILETEVIQVERGKGDDAEKVVVPRIELFGFEEGQAGGESTMIIRTKKGQLDELLKLDGSTEEARKALESAISVQIY